MTSQAEYEAAAARYAAISEHTTRLKQLVKEFDEQIEAEWSAANSLLARHQSQPGIAKPFDEGEPMSYEAVEEVYALAVRRLGIVFPWSRLPGFPAHAQAGVEAIAEASK